MNLAEAVAARRSVRAFQDQAVPRALVERAVSLAVQAPAPHHSSPWRFALLEAPEDKERLASDMGAAWRDDLTADGHPSDRIEAILSRSERLLRSTPLLTVCCADLSRSHAYPDDRRILAEWSLFAHSVGAALQIYMTALAESGVASCWISAPVFCREEVRRTLSLPAGVEPHALVLVGYASPDYHPRPRPSPDPRAYIL
ncbi:MAG: nitroreductase family protein [Actinomycetota bacterium]|nr:nitroreductase family protein [Actinomycetota bacterium]